MPVVKCKCGATTNTAVSEYWNEPENKDLVFDGSQLGGQANGCYAKFENGRWEKGCKYGEDEYMRRLADSLILTNEA